jgi:hypothetical protein
MIKIQKKILMKRVCELNDIVTNPHLVDRRGVSTDAVRRQ